MAIGLPAPAPAAICAGGQSVRTQARPDQQEGLKPSAQAGTRIPTQVSHLPPGLRGGTPAAGWRRRQARLRSMPILLALLAMAFVDSPRAAPVLEVALTTNTAPPGYLEIAGVEAGAFNPRIWQAGALNIIPDLRSPLLEPREGRFRNIYAPSAVETPDGYRVFYGAWDGVPTGNDRSS